ncbi:MAG: hypothetical protein K6L81_07765 [Agarilytica sp.]
MKCAVLVIYIFICFPFMSAALAEESNAPQLRVESDWLDMARGFKGGKLGLEVVSVSTDNESALNTVKVALPKYEEREIEEVLVIGRRGGVDYTIKLDQPVEVIRDYENGRSGIVVHLGEKTPFKLLINYIEYRP